MNKWRDYKRKDYKARAKKGLCMQCGSTMDSPVSTHTKKVSPSYCSKCQEYYQDIFKEQRPGSMLSLVLSILYLTHQKLFTHRI
ncbi:hypothetical protein [Lysinibacillus parviboronicapiens]|uniref:hypothetical protein n=1 Tax=Lysinibacillus parviboronicapiens TaxID=436516 RepID=UPI001EE75769|nr:hypothetical protein [Lysinibacillus parviboronicapiens]